MEINVLGDVEVLGSLGRRNLGAATATVLCALVAAGGRAVSTDRLLDVVWPNLGPADVERRRTTLRSHVAHLRKALDSVEPPGSGGSDGPAERITRIAHSGLTGYALTVPAGTTDIARFEALCDEAADTVRRGDPTAAVTAAQAALGLWRGDPLIPLADDDIGATMAAALGRRRQEVRELEVAALLDSGVTRAACAAAQELAAGRPGDDRAQELLILALFRDGRIDDAATACRAAIESRLDRGLRADGLQRLQEQVLNHDDLLREDQLPLTGPWQLPSNLNEFTGQRDLCAAIEKRIRTADPLAGPVVIALYGPPGVGKSALAKQIAQQFSGEYDGALYCELRAHGSSPRSSATALRVMLTSLSVDPGTTEDGELGALLRSATARRRLILLLDDAADAAHVRDLIPGGPEHLVIITSRRALSDLDGAGLFDVDTMADAEAHALLAQFVDLDRLSADPAATAELIGYCGGLPLAVRIVGGRLRERRAWPVRHLADRLADAHSRMRELQLGALSVAAAIHTGFSDLSDDEASTLCVLSDLGIPDVSVEIASAALQRDETECDLLLESLVDAQLLQSPDPGRYAMHDLIRVFAAGRLAIDEERHHLEHLAQWYLDTVTLANAVLLRGNDVRESTRFAGNVAARSWLDREVSGAIAFARRCSALERSNLSTFVVALEAALYTYLDLRSEWFQWADLCQLAISAATAHGEQNALGHAQLRLATTYARRNRLDDAHDALSAAQQNFKATQDAAGEARVLNSLGAVSHLQGRQDLAEPYLVDAAERFRAAGDRNSERTVLMNLGEIARMRKRLGDAETYTTRALEMAREQDDLREQGKCLHNLGEIARDGGHPEAARAWYDQALGLCGRSGDRHTAALSHFAIAGLAAQTGNLVSAIELARDSAAAMTELHAIEAAEILEQIEAWTRSFHAASTPG